MKIIKNIIIIFIEIILALIISVIASNILTYITNINY